MTGFFDVPKPIIIGEIGGNHEGDFARALLLTRQALASGADFVKFQVYRGDLIASRVAAPDRNAHFKRFELSDEQYLALAHLCGDKFSASAWDEHALELIDPLVSFHKVGSGDLTHWPLIEAIAAKSKPIVLSTAMSTLEEVQETVAVIGRANPQLIETRSVCLLHCVATYGDPRPEFANLKAITTLQRAFPELPVGYSDHTVGIDACIAALALGARVIEKHFSDDRERSFRDHAISATETEITRLAECAALIPAMLGDGEKKPIAAVEDEERIRSFRRGICAAEDLPAGARLEPRNLIALRPCIGVDVRDLPSLVGRRLKIEKRAHEPISAGDLE